MAKKNKYHVRPDGLHEKIITLPNGKRKAFRGRSDREVDRKLLEYREESERGRTFAQVADEWEREHEAEIRESTRRSYSCALNRLKDEFGAKRMKEIEPLDIQNYIRRFEAKGMAASTVQTELTVCRMICKHAVIRKDLRISPATEVRKSRGLPAKKREALNEEQEAAVKAAGEAQTAHWWLFGYLLLYAGLRRGEALALTYQDIDRKRGVIWINKKVSYATGSPVLDEFLKSENGQREVPLLPPLADALPRDRLGLIFPGRDGGYMKPSEIKSSWRQYCRDIGLNEVVYDDNGDLVETFPITPHCFRHSFATICYEAGLDPRQAASILGDTPEVMERVYTHLRNRRRETASEKLTAYFKNTSAV